MPIRPKEMSDKKVIKLADAANSGTHRSPENMLEEALKEVREGQWAGRKKALVITVDEEDDSYIVNWMQAGLKMSQCVSLCEVAKVKFLTEMNYVKENNGE